MEYLIVPVIAYFIGSIPFGVLIARMLGLGNLRDIGSGNIGATNVLRTGNKFAAVLTLILDGLKGFVPVYLCHQYAPYLMGVAMLFAIIGHCFPIWLNFKGGKGVATYIGATLGMFWVLGVIAICIWIITAMTKRISSLAALMMVIMMILMSLIFTPHFVIWFALSAALIIYQHRANIERLRNGTEPKIGSKS